jgi:hypothetical protein
MHLHARYMKVRVNKYEQWFQWIIKLSSGYMFVGVGPPMISNVCVVEVSSDSEIIPFIPACVIIFPIITDVPCYFGLCLDSYNGTNRTWGSVFDGWVLVYLSLMMSHHCIGLGANVAWLRVGCIGMIGRKDAGHGPYDRADSFVHCLLLGLSYDFLQGWTRFSAIA